MGFVRSLKKIFKNGKKENRLSDIENARMENEHRVTKKSKPVSRQKSMRTGIYEPYRNHFPLKQSQVPACQQQAPRLPYGAYDPTKAKLITAGGEINMDGPGEKHVTASARPMSQSAKIAAMQNGNYELFDWRQSNQSLNQYNSPVSVYEQHQFNRNGAQYGSNRSVLSVGGGAMAMNQNRNGPMRGSTRSFSAINFGMNQQQFMGSQQSLNMYQQQQQQQQQYNRNNYEFHQTQQQQQLSQQQQQREQRINQLSGRCGTGSVSSIHSLQSCTDRPSRPSSVQMMPTGPYQDWSVNKQRQSAGGITSASMSSLNALAPQLNQLQSVVQNAVQMNSANPTELADAMRKMEECLQVFAQISSGGGPKPTANQMQGNQMTNQMANQLARIEANRMAGVVSPTNIQNRSQNLLQPQPEFQKREQMKKRRQRRKSDISKMDLTELRRKLESIDVDSDTTENNSEGEKSNVKNIRKNSTATDGGFYDGSGSSSDSGSSRQNAGSPTSSGDNLSGYMSTGSNSSDSGVVTPPITQKVKNMPEGSVKDSKKKNRNSNTPKSILKTNQQISFQI